MAIPSVPQQPTNQNLLPPNKFVLSVASLPDVQFWCQTVNIPGVSIGEAIRNTPFIDLFSPGDKAILNPFSVTFLVDEDFLAWNEIFKWMVSLTFPENFQQYKDLDKRYTAWRSPMPQFSDITLTILNARQNPKLRIKFINCFPVSLSDVVLSTTSTPEDAMTSDVTFRFDYFEVEKIA